jgi:hypothetical protein
MTTDVSVETKRFIDRRHRPFSTAPVSFHYGLKVAICMIQPPEVIVAVAL